MAPTGIAAAWISGRISFIHRSMLSKRNRKSFSICGRSCERAVRCARPRIIMVDAVRDLARLGFDSLRAGLGVFVLNTHEISLPVHGTDRRDLECVPEAWNSAPTRGICGRDLEY
jgi:hypothetical protein